MGLSAESWLASFANINSDTLLEFAVNNFPEATSPVWVFCIATGSGSTGELI